MRLSGCWVSGILLVLIATSAEAAPYEPKQNSDPVETSRSDSFRRQAVTVLLRTSAGQQLGSGVLAAEADGGLWVASNRHVVGDLRTVCVVTADRSVRAGLVVPQQQRQKLDLALVWLPSAQREAVLVADVTEKLPAAHTLPLVVATGFPTTLGSALIDGPAYSERSGLLVQLLREPLQDGLDLTYTARVDKGMSGGGVFIGSDLIGINSAHRDPLWPGQWHDAKGEAVSEQMNQKLDLVSLGVSSKQINQAIKAASAPSGNDLNQLVGVECSQRVAPAQPGEPTTRL